ncbi:large polymerase protein [avian paramyxovirus 16]|uniref:RNA-directed RNA polymerase L n=1 Tax=avian paramyxovirus 16 TaxID=2560322 RepID=A0A1Z1G738_9MONO|nr:large polymerase protein [Avian paramyxovirus UPO216]ARV85980.1 large polymerase protein [Avian paramyxovirus UPO216]
MAEPTGVRAEHQIILPESHLSSPLVKHKLLYYWKLTGLPLPEECEFDPLILGRQWRKILETGAPDTERMVKLGRLAHQNLNHNKPIRGLLHPRTLTMLTTIEIPDSSKKFRTIEKKIQIHNKVFGGLFNTLCDQVEQKLLGRHSKQIISRSPEYLRLREDPAFWFHSAWSSAKFAWLHIKQLQRHLTVCARSRMGPGNPITLIHNHGQVFVTPELVIITENSSNQFTCLTQEMVLSYSDMLEGRDMVSFVSSTATHLLPLKDKIQSLLLLIDALAMDMGNNVYEVISLMEGLAYGAVQLLEPSELFAGNFLSFNLHELKDILLPHFRIDIVQRIITIVSEVFSGLDQTQSAEMLCMLRLWGHPLLESRAAASAVRKQMCAPKLLDFDTVLQVLSFFKGTIINGYRKKNAGVWPRVKQSTVYGSTITQLHADSAEISHEIMLKEYKNLSALEFEQCIDFDPVSNLSMFLKDKAIAHPKHNWLASFRKNLLSDTQKKEVRDATSTNRLLIEFLESEDFDPYEEMKYLTTLEYLRDKNVAVSYSLKEKEVKVNGRIFAKLTKRLRNCQVMAEGILADQIAPFFQGNGVIQDSISLTKSMLAMSQLSFNSNKKRIVDRKEGVSKDRHRDGINRHRRRVATFITTDLQKYCLNWRYQTIKLFAHAINQLMGLPHFFEWIHLRLMDTTMFVGDPFNPPSNPSDINLDDAQNDDIFIVSARGGIEGLCQKLWTMISISAIQLAAARAHCRVACMVQGDNQVIAVTKEVDASDPPETVLQQLHEASNSFFNELMAVNHNIGHNLKDRETLRSDTFFIYSKRIFKDGTILGQALKNASKLVLISGDLSENTVMSCSNISSTIARLCENGLPKDFCYYLNYLMSCIQTYFDKEFSIFPYNEARRLDQNKEDIKFVHTYVLTPAQVGGLSNLQYSRLYTRNIGDPGTTAFAELKRLETAKLIPKQVIINILTRPPGNGDWASLCNDPYSFNFETVSSPNIVLKKHTQRVLFETCSNPLLSGVHTEDNEAEEKMLAEFLLNQESIHPRVAHAIMEASSVGRRKQIQGLVDTTNTVIKIALSRRPLGYKRLSRIINYSRMHEELFKEEVFSAARRGSPLVNSEMCSLALADYARQRSWSILTGGRQILGVSNPDTIELVEGEVLSLSGGCRLCDSGDEQFTWFHLPRNICLTDDTNSNPPMRVPYLGSKTQERRAASLAKIAHMSPHVKAALRASSVLIWAYGDNETNWSAALKIARSRCNISSEYLRLLSPLPTAGNLQHRLDDGITQMTFTPASLYRVSPYVHISNDSQRLFTEEGVKEGNVVYQQIMLLGLSLLESLFPLTTTRIFDEVTLHLHSKFSCCIREAPVSVPFELQGYLPDLRTVASNKFMFDPQPITDTDFGRLNLTIFRSYELNLDSYPTIELMNVLAIASGKLIGQSVVSYDEDTSIKNDAILVYDNTRNWISEAQNCDVVKLFEYAALEILLDCAYQLYYLRVRGLDNMVLYMSSLLKNMPGILLSNIAATISHPVIHSRLHSVGLINHDGAHQLASVDFVETSARLLTTCIRRIVTGLHSGNKYDLLFPSVLDDNLTEKMLQLISRLCCVLVLLYSTTKAIPKIRGLSAEEKCATLTSYLLSDAVRPTMSSAQIDSLLSPNIVTFPANLYYMSRKSLNLIREREDRDTVLALIFPPDVIMEAPDIRSLGSRTDDPMTKSPAAFIKELAINAPARYDTCFPSQLTQMEGTQSRPDEMLIRYLFRGIGTASSSWYKAAHLLSIPEVRLARHGNSLFLAEGSGAIMSLLELHVPHEVIFYNTLFSNEQNPPQRHFGPTPTQFLNSVVYKNLQANVPCKDGFVQEYVPLWRENADESDLSSDKSVSYITSTVPFKSVSLMHCDIEVPMGSNQSYLDQVATNLALIAMHTIRDKGVFIVKVLFSMGYYFHLLINLFFPCSTKCYVVSNGYACRGDLECYLIFVMGYTGGSTFVREVVRMAKDLVRRNGTLLHSKDERTLMEVFNAQFMRVQELTSLPTPGLIRILQKNIDGALIEAGGQPVRPLCRENLSPACFDATKATDIIASHIDTAIRSVIYIEEGGALADTVFLFTPYNLSVEGKKLTSLTQCTRQIFDMILLSITKEDQIKISEMMGIVLKGTVCLEDLIPLRMYLKRSTCPKYLKEVLGMQKLRELFKTTSRFVLSRSTQKYYMKIIGNAIKGYYSMI